MSAPMDDDDLNPYQEPVDANGSQSQDAQLRDNDDNEEEDGVDGSAARRRSAARGSDANGDNDQAPASDEESEGEDLLDEAIVMDDYKQIAELDQYDERYLDEREYEALDSGDRANAERIMRERDAERARAQGRLPAALQEEDEDDSDPLVDEPRKRRRIVDEDQNLGDEMMARDSVDSALNADENAEAVDLDAHHGPVDVFLALEATRREIRNRLFRFFRSFQEDESRQKRVSFYNRRISDMARNNGTSLVVLFDHLARSLTPAFIRWLGDAPEQMLEICDEAAYLYTVSRHPSYAAISSKVHVRISQLPVKDEIRDLRERHLNSLVKVAGVVTRRTAVFPQLQEIMLTCPRCNNSIGPFLQHDAGNTTGTGSDKRDLPSHTCADCQYQGYMPINVTLTIWRNYQRVTLQEPPSSVPAGRVPRSKDVILLHDLIDSVTPGEQVQITGIYKHHYDRSLNIQDGFPIFSTVIIANHIASQKEQQNQELTPDEKAEILALSKQANIAQRIYASMGPSIYGHEHLKQALALAMFGGSAKEFENGHRIRGDINVLMVGDPGTAKSQLLKYVEQLSPRGVYTTGKGASAVGLTASVHKDPLTREWTLEGGALVLADQGLCCIDEFDKMNDQDRTSIHEAMEQQSISISKAGIITTLKARCSVIAAANPVTGRYNAALPFSDNVELTDAILSRFDIMCVVRDTVDREHDERLAQFVVKSHFRSHPTSLEEKAVLLNQYENECAQARALGEARPEMSAQLAILTANDARKSGAPTSSAAGSSRRHEPIPQALFKKYILYARSHFKPTLDRVDDDKIATLYAKLRKESFVSGGLPISVRHIESLIRMSEAHAKMHLRLQVLPVDIDAAITCMLESFISTQKFSIMRSLRKSFDPYLTRGSDTHQLILYALQALINEVIQTRVLRHDSLASSGVLDIEVLQQEELLQAVKTPVKLKMDDVNDKLREINIGEAQFSSFLSSALAKDHRFVLSANGKQLIKSFDDEMEQQE